MGQIIPILNITGDVADSAYRLRNVLIDDYTRWIYKSRNINPGDKLTPGFVITFEKSKVSKVRIRFYNVPDRVYKFDLLFSKDGINFDKKYENLVSKGNNADDGNDFVLLIDNQEYTAMKYIGYGHNSLEYHPEAIKGEGYFAGYNSIEYIEVTNLGLPIIIEPSKDKPRSKEIEQKILDILNENDEEVKTKPHIYMTALINSYQQILATVCKINGGDEGNLDNNKKWLDFTIDVLNRQIKGYFARQGLIKPTA